jgi:hypothetical protein
VDSETESTSRKVFPGKAVAASKTYVGASDPLLGGKGSG